MTSDRIEKTTVLRVPRWRVWQVLSNTKEFVRWFGIEFDREFAPHAWLRGKVTTPDCESVPAIPICREEEPKVRSYLLFCSPSNRRCANNTAESRAGPDSFRSIAFR